MSTMGYVTTLTGIEDSASVLLDFAKNEFSIKGVKKTFEDIFTTTRSTKAARYNEKGLFEMVAADKARFDYDPITKVLKGVLTEEQRTNIVVHSSDIIKWGTTRATLIPNATTSPDGTMNATKVSSTSVSDWHYTSSPTFAVANATTYTATIYAKAAELPRVRVGLMDNNIFSGATVFDLVTGTRVSGSAGDITPVGDGWYRCSLISTSKAAGNSGLSINPVKAGEVEANTAGDGKSGIYIWGGQVEAGTFSTSFIPTESSFTSRSTTATYFDKNGTLKTAGVNIPRSDAYMHDQSGKLLKAGMLVENAATNLFQSSTMFETAPWGKNRVDAVPSSLPALSGVGVFRELKTTSIAGGSSIYYNGATLPTNSFTTESFYVKAGTTDRCSLRFYDGVGSGAMATFNLTSGTIVSSSGPVLIDAKIQPVGGGIFRVSLTADYTTRNQAGLALYLYVNFDNPKVGDSVFAWGAQLEAGTAPTSYIEPIPTFVSRASTATYFNSQGVMQTAPVNVARTDAYNENKTPIGTLLEVAATNLVQQSQRFTGNGWSRTVSGTGLQPVVVDNTTVAPDGSLTAATVRFNAPDTNAQSSLNQSFVTVLDARYTGSVYIKASRPSDVGKIISMRHAGNTGFIYITLTDKWVRVESVEAANSTAGVFLINLRPALGTSMGEVEVSLWGAQVELGAYATSYIPTLGTFTGRTSTATYTDATGVFAVSPVGVERTDAYGFDENGTIQRIGVVRENAATNLITNSDDFTVGWSNNGPGGVGPITLTKAASAGPRGANTMTRLTKSDSSIRYMSKTFSAAIGSQVSASVYAKAADNNGILSVRLQSNYSNRCDAWFNLTTGVCGVSVVGDLVAPNVYMVRQANGTFRCVMTVTSGAVAWGTVLVTNQDRNGVAVDANSISVPQDIYIDCAQVENFPFASSYIPTTTAAVARAADTYSSATVTRASDTYTTAQATRAADLVSSGSSTRSGDNIYMPSILDWYNSPASTFYTEFVPGTIGVGSTCVSFWLRNVADNNNIVAIRKDGSQNNITGIITSSTGVIQAQITAINPVTPGSVAKTVLSYKLNSASISNNGSSIVNDPLVTPPTPERMYIGSSSNNQQYCNGWIGKILYYPFWMSDSQLPVITNT